MGLTTGFVKKNKNNVKKVLTNRMYYDIHTCMKNKLDISRVRRQNFLKQVEDLWPIARGSVSEVYKPCIRKGCKACESGQKHRSHIYTYREDGKLRCRHVRPEFVEELSLAIENGRKLELILSRFGNELIEELRRRGE